MVRFLYLLNKTYKEAAKMYRFSMTTTNRPVCLKNRKFLWIYITDPHLLCVPSLHISIIALVCIFYREALKEPEFTEEEQKVYWDEIFSDGIKIAESVLYIKQHSVNCIPAALYMMTHIVRPYFTAEDGIAFLEAMFKDDKRITAEQKHSISEYMNFIYERFLLEGVAEQDWRKPVQRWLIEYAHNTGQQFCAAKIRNLKN